MEEIGDMDDVGAQDAVDEMGNPIKKPVIKTQMCKKLQETGKCNGIKDKSCKFAHNAIELTLIPASVKSKNLKAVIVVEKQRLQHNKVPAGWLPAGK